MNELLFDPKTYEGCKVVTSYEDPETLRLEGVHGTDLNVIMTRQIDETWKVVIRVDFEMSGARRGFHTGHVTDEKVRTFWNRMIQQGHRGNSEAQDKMVERAIAIIKGDREAVKPTGKKK